MAILVLIRGPLGSWKSTYARKYFSDYNIIETDQYFYENGEYKFDKNKLWEAHERCYFQTKKALERWEKVVVANTFTRLWELQKYIDLSSIIVDEEKPVVVYKMNWEIYQKEHGVPYEKVLEQKQKFESYPWEISVTLE